jgi:tyrosyl-tRNA synthetase
MVNNYDWFQDIGFIEFLRETGKHLTVSYMMAKESVQQRLETGISFTEFSYQLLQAHDFCHLNTTKDCILQLGGSDQWGNITSGTELIRRKTGGEAYALTCPLVTRADGTKFGKTASGEAVWLDPEQTSPYKFYQFWLNSGDTEASRYIRVFTLLSKEEIEGLEHEHMLAPHERILQKALAKDITERVHSPEAYEKAVAASEILFGKATTDALHELDERSFLDVFAGVPQVSTSRDTVSGGVNIVELLTDFSQFCSSRGEARRLIRNGGISINKEKVADENATVSTEHLLNNKYILLQKGKKSYCIVESR